MIWVIYLSLLVLFESLADILAKEYSLKGHWYLWVAGIAGYIIANIFWLSAMKHGAQLGRGAIIFSVASAILAIIIGVCFYHENTNKIQLIGIVLGIISLVLIFWE